MNQPQTRSYEIQAGERPLIVEGTAIVFNKPAQINGYTERIAPNALAGVSLDDIALLINHDGAGIPLARSPKTLTLTITDKGLDMRAQLPDTEQGRAVYGAVKRGDLSQMSFAFDIGAQDVDAQARTATITVINAIYELSIVTRAAYPQTSVQARHQTMHAGKEENMMSTQTFNPIESAVFDAAKGAGIADTHAAPEYRSAFYKSLLGQTLSEAETRAMSAARAEKRADAFNTLTSSAAVVPTNTLNQIIAGPHPQGGLWNEVRHFSVPANLAVPVGTPIDPAAWHIEGAAVDRKDVTTHNVMFHAYELIKVLSMSAAAKRMTITAFESYITSELAHSITDAINAAIVSGTGTGQPQGLMTGITWDASNSLTNAAASIIDGILKTIAKLPAGYSSNAKFAMNNATLFSSIYPAKTTDGALVLIPDAQNGRVRRLFGFEIVVDDHLPASTILFGNFKYYGVNIPEGVAIETSRESGFANGLIDFRALTIADGKPIVPEAFIKLTVTGAA
jgi:HK97 family phage major capsid protein/HK97 family phage prohead protease